MRILYDGTIFGLQKAGGINRYFLNLIGGLPEECTPVYTTLGRYPGSEPVHPNLQTRLWGLRFRPRRLSGWLEQGYFRTVFSLERFDIVHPTYYSLLSGDPLARCRRPLVLTVWDMIHELFAEQMDPTGTQAEMKRRAIQAARAIICISESTRRDLLARFDLAGKHVSVIPLASELDPALDDGWRPSPDRPYYIYVGGRFGYKNFDGLLTAFAKVASVRSELLLRVVGPLFTTQEERYIESLGLTGRIDHQGQVSDGRLVSLYRHSLALVYPSLYEGFGIPPLEAMSCGTAVIASNCSSIPEVVGDAALLVDPRSTAELAEGLLFLADRPLEREALVARGGCRSRLFSWARTTRETLRVYANVA